MLPPARIPDLPAGVPGRDAIDYLGGIGGEVRASRSYMVIPGVTASAGVNPVTTPDPPVVFWEGVYPPPCLEWGRTYAYALSLIGPNAVSSIAGGFAAVRTPRLPPAPRVQTIANPPAGGYAVAQLYGLTALVRRTNGLYAETPVGPLAYAAPRVGVTGADAYRISVPDAAAEPAIGTPDLRIEGYYLYRAAAPATGQPIAWAGRLGWLNAGDSWDDDGSLAPVVMQPATTGGPRVFVQGVAPPYRPDLAYRVYGRDDQDGARLLVQLAPGDGSPWVDDGTVVPRSSGPPTYPVRSPGIGEGLYAAGNVHQFTFRSRFLRLEPIDGPMVVQLDAGEGRWQPELAILEVREVHFSGDRIRVRSADPSGVQQTRYLIEVWD